MHKINTTAYHPLDDGLVENFNRTLQCMIAKHAKEFWDLNLQQLLFAYRVQPSQEGNHCFPSRTAEIHSAQQRLHSPNPCQSMRWMIATTGRRSVNHGMTTGWEEHLPGAEAPKRAVRQESKGVPLPDCQESDDLHASGHQYEEESCTAIPWAVQSL